MDAKEKYEKLFSSFGEANLEELAQMFNCSVDDIYDDDINDETEGFDSIPYKIVIGDVDLSGFGNVDDLGELEVVLGSVNLGQYGKVTPLMDSLGKLKFVYGDMFCSFNAIEDVSSLIAVGGDANFEECRANSESNLEYVGGYLALDGSEIKSAKKLQYVGGDLYLQDSRIHSLDSLEYVGGNIEADDDLELNFKKGRSR